MSANDQLHIIHGDLDAFFAAVEQRENPALQGQPVIVGGHLESRGVVSTCSYEARRFGVKSAMPIVQAMRLCPQGIFLPVNMKLYRQVSQQVMAIMASYTPLLEKLSIDEAFLDVSGCTSLFGTAPQIAAEIKARVWKEHSLRISMGISYNKYLAKLATELGKPDGLRVILRGDVPAVLLPLPVDCLWGAGEKTLRILGRMGIKTIGELAQTPLPVLERQLGNQAHHFLQLAEGIDLRRVEPERESKSLGREMTFEQDLNDREYLGNVLLDFAGKLAWRLRMIGQQAQTITIKVRFGDFRTLTRSRTIPQPSDNERIFHQTAAELLAGLEMSERPVRLIGLSLSRLCRNDDCRQGQLFAEETAVEKRNLDQALDWIRDRFGADKITRASLLSWNDDD